MCYANAMEIIDVIPLASLPGQSLNLLSFFHPTPLPRGAVVEVLLRHRKIRAVVAGSDSLNNRKLALKKNLSFEVKKISKVISTEPMVSENQFRIAQMLSDYYQAPLGICLKTVLPPFWGKRGYAILTRKTNEYQ